MEELTVQTEATESTLIDIEKFVKEMFDKGAEVEEINGALKKMLDDKKISEEDYKKGVELVANLDKELASKQFGVNIL